MTECRELTFSTTDLFQEYQVMAEFILHQTWERFVDEKPDMRCFVIKEGDSVAYVEVSADANLPNRQPIFDSIADTFRVQTDLSERVDGRSPSHYFRIVNYNFQNGSQLIERVEFGRHKSYQMFCNQNVRASFDEGQAKMESYYHPDSQICHILLLKRASNDYSNLFQASRCSNQRLLEVANSDGGHSIKLLSDTDGHVSFNEY